MYFFSFEEKRIESHLPIAFENENIEYMECDNKMPFTFLSKGTFDGLRDPGENLSLPEDVRNILTERYL